MDNKCSFCCGSNHTIRFCSSPIIQILEQNMAHYYYNVLQRSLQLELDEQGTEELFVSDIIEKCTYRELRVLAVTCTEAATSGINKEQYAHILYAFYKQTLDNILNQINYSFNDLIRNLMTDFDDVATSTSSKNLEKKHNIIPYLNPVSNDVNNDVNNKEDNDKIVADCSICLREDIKISDLVKLNCCHQFCGECVTKTLETHSSDINPVSCALCRANVTRIDVNSSDCFTMVSKFCKI